MSWQILEGDVRERLRDLDDESVQTVVTSPPYWGLRDYGTEGQLGLEPTPEEYVANLVAVFAEARRVLRDDGTLWLNLGDSYNSVGHKKSHSGFGTTGLAGGVAQEHTPLRRENSAPGLKHKDLVGIPWMVAFALRADGWWLRSDIIWSKPNPMPESVTDRPTRAHEYLFLLTKSARYFYDAEAIREEGKDWSQGGPGTGIKTTEHYGAENGGNDGLGKLAGRYKQDGHGRRHAGFNGRWDERQAGADPLTTRNKRSVWTVTTQPYPDAHFAAFPPKLVEPCILAGSPPKCCGECGAPWERVTEDGGLDSMEVSERPQQRRAAQLAKERGLSDDHLAAARATGPADVGRAKATQNGVNADQTAMLAAEAKESLAGYFREFTAPIQVTTGWRSTCVHDDDSGSPTVLDPFCGSGTTGLVALRHERSFVGIELNPDYCELARNRIRDDAPLLNGHAETIEMPGAA